MDVYRGVSVGQLTNPNTGQGTWTAFTGGGYSSNPEPISFGSQFLGVSQVYLVDPAAGGSTLPSWWTSYWDDLVLQGPGQTDTTITVQPFDPNGFPLGSGQTVVIATTAGQLLGSVVDNLDGTYSQQLRSDPLAPGATVSATVNGAPVPRTVTVNFYGGGPVDPSRSGLSAPYSITACGGEATLTVWPRNVRGEAICRQNLPVVFQSTAGTLLGTATANPDGSYSQVLQADPMELGATVRVAVDGVQLNSSSYVRFTGGGPADRYRSSISVNPARISICGGETTVRIYARNARYETICRDGLSVEITPTGGTMLGDPDNPAPGFFTQVFQATPAPTHVTTYGHVSAKIIEGSTVTSLYYSSTIYLEPVDPDQSTITVSPSTLLYGGRATVTITPRNCAGEIITGSLSVSGYSTLGYWSDYWARNVDGTYSRVLNINRLGTADITARLNSIPLNTGISLLVVDPNDLGKAIGITRNQALIPYMSIQHAVNSIKDDKLVQILVTEGTHRETVRFKRDSGDVIVEGLSVAGPVTLDGIRIEKAGGLTFKYLTVDAKEIEGRGIRAWKAAGLTLQNCTVKNTKEDYDGIDIGTHSSNVWLVDCYAQDNGGDGIRIGKGGDATVDNCQAYRNGQDGLEIDKRADVKIQRGNFLYNKEHGIDVDKQATVSMNASSSYFTYVRYNELNGINVNYRANVALRYPYVSENHENGIYVGKGAVVTTYQGDSIANWKHGLVCDRAKNVAIQYTVFRNNRENGVVVGMDSTVSMRSPSVYRNYDHGIVVDQKGSLTMDYGYVQFSGQIGIRLHRRAAATLNRVYIRYNGYYVPYGSEYGYGLFAERGVMDPTRITLTNNDFYANRGKIVSGRSTAHVGNYDVILDSTDQQSSY